MFELNAFDYEDIQLVPNKCIVNSRSECDTTVKLGKHTFKLPVVPANMQTVIDESVAEFLAENGYFYIMHRFDEASRLPFVKRMKERGLISSISVGVKPQEYDFIVELKEYSISHNRANSVGEALEEYVKDIFSGTLFETDKNKRMEIISEVFSYLGNTNNPPDSILRDGDAIEVKKIENKSSSLALNSSYPKAKLYSNSSMITDACRNCEEWKEKDIIYAIGTCEKNKLTSLIFVYGEDYAAENKIYENHIYIDKTGRLKTILTTTRVS